MIHKSGRPPFDPELRQPFEAMEAPLPASATLDVIPQFRQGSLDLDAEKLSAVGIEWRDVMIPGFRGDPITVSVYQWPGRTGTGPGVISFHGGGWVTGNRHGGCPFWPFLTDLMKDCNGVVVSVEYRLAPEHPDPYPVEDCYAALIWTASHLSELGIDPERLMLAGHSAGGGLVAGVVLLARDRNGPALCAQLVSSALLDDRDDAVSKRQFEHTGIWNVNRIAWTALLGNRRSGDDVSIYAAPARATDLSGLPPAFIDCGSADLYRDENVAFASAIWAAGGQAELHVWAGGFHGFNYVTHARLSIEANATQLAWVRRVLRV